ncbi:MAG TPA: hypothetical protein VIO36_05530 [Anaerolineaceae bacterium]
MTHCDYCGFEFDPTCSLEGGCSGCPLASGCAKVVCPRCGYQMLPEAKLIGAFRQLREKIQAARRGSQTTRSTQK